MANNSFRGEVSVWLPIEQGVPPGSILGVSTSVLQLGSWFSKHHELGLTFLLLPLIQVRIVVWNLPSVWYWLGSFNCWLTVWRVADGRREKVMGRFNEVLRSKRGESQSWMEDDASSFLCLQARLFLAYYYMTSWYIDGGSPDPRGIPTTLRLGLETGGKFRDSQWGARLGRAQLFDLGLQIGKKLFMGIG